MTPSMHSLAADTFIPMLESLSGLLDKGASHELERSGNLVTARLAEDMYTLAQQVEEACRYAKEAMARLAGGQRPDFEDPETTFEGLQAQIARTLEAVRGVEAAAFEGAAERDCSIPIADDRVIEMDGTRFLLGWTFPHFYFHVVTAYDILRHHGVVLSKNDYLSQVGGFIRSKSA